LLAAARNCRTKVIETLLKRGVELERTNQQGETALMVAAK